MDIEIRPATVAEVPAIIADMDQQFVFGKGRSISLAQRYPGVYGVGNLPNIFVAQSPDGIVAALACKLFTFQQNGLIYRGAMLGGVYTLPQCRGLGIASTLLVETAKRLRQRGLDFAVLWTDQPAFYARSGWIVSDRGVLGLISTPCLPSLPATHLIRQAAHAADAHYVNQLREHWLSSNLVMRDGDAYRSLPLPAGEVTLLLCGNTPSDAAYALLGSNGDTGILYEMVGNPAAYADLWAEIGQAQRLYVNDVHGSASQRWLSAHTSIVWQDKALAMWLPLSANMPASPAAYGYIPYFDRI